MRTIEKDLAILSFILLNIDLSKYSCQTLLSTACFAGYSLKEADQFLDEYRNFSGANLDEEGFMDCEEWASLTLDAKKNIRREKLGKFDKYLYKKSFK